MTAYRYSCSFGLDSYIRSDRTQQLNLYAHLNSKTRPFNTGLKLHAHQWDHKAQLVVLEDAPDAAKRFNLMLERLRMRSQGIFLDHLEQQVLLTPTIWVQKMHRGYAQGAWAEFMAAEIAEQAKDLTEATIIQHTGTMKRLLSFRPNLRIGQIDLELVKEWNRWLKQYRHNGALIHMNTVYKHHKFFRRYLNIAVAKNLLPSNPYALFRPHRQKSRKKFLTIEELRKLDELLSSGTLTSLEHRVLRGFLAACFNGGVRFSDCKQLTQDLIVNDAVVFVQEKLKRFGTTARVPLSEIGKKYLNMDSAQLIDLPSNQKTNDALKTIAAKAGIHKRITFHMSRHTFGTISLKLGVPPQITKSIMGIVKWQTMNDYIHTAEDWESKEIGKMGDVFST